MKKKQKRKKRRVFSRFYDDHVEKVYRFVYLKVSSKEVSEDITSEAFLRLWEQIKSPTEVRNPRAYVYQVARHLVIDHYRKKEPVKVQPGEVVLEDDQPGPEEEAILDQEQERVVRALGRINDNYQNVLILYYLDDMPVSEIAEIEGKSENAVRVTIHRALKALEEELEQDIPSSG